MKRGIVLLGICVGIAVLATLAIQYSTEAQQPGGPGGRSRRPMGGQMVARMLPLETSWAQISFELDTSDEVISKARKIYRAAWAERKKLTKKLEAAAGDREAMRSMRSDVEKIQSDVATKLKDVLSAEQLEKLAKWEKENQDRMRRSQGTSPRRQRSQ